MKVSPAAFVRTTLPLDLSGLAELDTGRYHSVWLPDHMLAGRPATLTTRLVEHAELADALPPETARVTSAERTALMWERFDGIRNRFPL